MFQVLALNMGMVPVGGTLGNHRARAKVLAHNILLAKPDVVVLSEMFVGDGASALKGDLSRSNEYFVHGPFAGGSLVNSGLVMAFRRRRVRFLGSGFREFGDSAGMDSFASKGVAFAKVAVDTGPSLIVLATHMQADVKHRAVRARQLRNIDAYRKTLVPRHADWPWLLAGDLNVVGGSAEYMDMMSLLGDPVDSWMAAGNATPGYTWDPQNSWVDDSSPGERLDYVLLGRSTKGNDLLRPVTSRTQRFMMTDGSDLSDHLGLSTDIEMTL